MIPLVRAGSVLGLVFLVATASSAATQKEIDAAVQKGSAHLKDRLKGGRASGAADGLGGIGPTALAGIALIETKTPANDPTLQAVAAAVRDAAYRETSTYSVALALIFFDRLEDPADVPLIQVLAVRLLAGQNAQGGWGYNCIEAVAPADEQRLRAGLKNPQLVGGANPPAGKPGPKDDAPAKNRPAARLHPEVEKYAAFLAANRKTTGGDDNSNTQFAVMGVWIARKHGVPVDAALDLIEKRFLSSQEQTGGWPYSGAGGGPGSPSMTCAGLIGLSTGLARREERRALATEAAPKPKDPHPKDPRAADPFFNPGGRADKPAEKKAAVKHPPDARDVAVQAGMANLGAHLGAATQAGGLVAAGGRMGERDLYFMWSLERVGVIFGTEKIAGLDWYALGADAIVRAQNQDGSWAGGYSLEVSTSFALLFLIKANLASDLSSKVQKQPGGTELRAGNGPTRAEQPAGPKTTGSASVPGPTVTPKPLPTPAEDGAARTAAALVNTSAADWTKALEIVRDAKGPDNTRALVLAIHQLDGDRKKQSRAALAERLTRMTAETLQEMTKADDAELRRGAVLACAMKDDKVHVPHLIDRLADEEELVARAAHAGLKSLTGQDFGPAAGATREQRKAAADAWRTWWASRK